MKFMFGLAYVLLAILAYNLVAPWTLLLSFGLPVAYFLVLPAIQVFFNFRRRLRPQIDPFEVVRFVGDHREVTPASRQTALLLTGVQAGQLFTLKTWKAHRQQLLTLNALNLGSYLAHLLNEQTPSALLARILADLKKDRPKNFETLLNHLAELNPQVAALFRQ